MEYSELDLEVGDTIHIGNRTLTLLDTDDGVGLFQVDSDDEYRPVSGEEFYEMLVAEGEFSAAVLPR